MKISQSRRHTPSVRMSLAAALMCTLALGSCSNSPSGGGSASLAVFTDPATGATTHDVYDIDNQLVQFESATGRLMWVSTGVSFAGYPVDGTFIGSDRPFQVRFGGFNGATRAYFTETVPATICNIEITSGVLHITPTTTTVPR